MNRQRAQARRVALRRLLSTGTVRSQAELVDSLGALGYPVTQTTVSRDLTVLGATKLPVPGGQDVYRLPREENQAPGDYRQVAALMRQFVTDIRHSLNLAVLRTPPGAASPVAAALDGAGLEGVLATVAGDDTILVVGEGEQGGSRLARRLEEIMEI